MRRLLFGVAILFIIQSAGKAAIVLNFDDLTSTTAYSNGQPVPANTRLSTQYLATDGIRFSSGSPYVAVGNYGSAAPSGTSAIAGTSASGDFDYAATVFFTFWDPADTSLPATTNFFSMRRS